MTSATIIAGVLHDVNLRLCRLRTWPNYVGFGFNVKFSSKPPHVIQFVKPYSPAIAADLYIKDVILAIDNKDALSIDAMQCLTILARAAERTGRVELLVVSKRSYRSLKKHGIPFDVKHATVITTPRIMPDAYQAFANYQPRICEIFLTKSDDRFGFDIANDDEEIGACIGEIYPGTPASQTVLRPGDRILEINKRFVDRKSKKYIFKKLHHAVLMRSVRLFVMDAETYRHYQSNDLSLSSNKYKKRQLEIVTTMKREGQFSLLICSSIEMIEGILGNRWNLNSIPNDKKDYRTTTRSNCTQVDHLDQAMYIRKKFYQVIERISWKKFFSLSLCNRLRTAMKTRDQRFASVKVI